MVLRLSKKYREKKIPVTDSASAAIPLPAMQALRQDGRVPQLEIVANGIDVIVAFGDANITAVDTINETTFDRPGGTYMLRDGAYLLYDLSETDDDYVSVLGLSDTVGASLTIRPGYGEV